MGEVEERRKEMKQKSTEKALMQHIERLFLKDVPKELKQDIALAAVHFLHEGFGDTPTLRQWANDLGALCPWDGRPHRSDECDARAEEFDERRK